MWQITVKALIPYWWQQVTYYPTGNQQGTDRTAAFSVLRDGLNIIGGYPGRGGTRNRGNYNTFLSGNIGNPFSTSDNSYHVVTVKLAGANSGFDGFIITGGYADGSGDSASANGGGIYSQGNDANDNGFYLTNSVVINNTALYNGGGLYNVSNMTQLTNCVFTGNAAGSGSAIYTTNGDPYAELYCWCKLLSSQAIQLPGMAGLSAIKTLVTAPLHFRMIFFGVILQEQALPAEKQFYGNGSFSGAAGECVFQGGLPSSLIDNGNISTNPMFADTANPIGNDGEWMTTADIIATYSRFTGPLEH